MCAGVEKRSCPFDRCHETSRCAPIVIEVAASVARHRYQAIPVRFTEALSAVVRATVRNQCLGSPVLRISLTEEIALKLRPCKDGKNAPGSARNEKGSGRGQKALRQIAGARSITRTLRFCRISERFGHLSQNRRCGGNGVRSMGDGAADDQVAGALAQGFGGRGYALLVADGGAHGADAGDDEYALRAGEGTEGSNLLWGADKAANSFGDAHAGKKVNLSGGCAIEANGRDLGGIHAGEHGDGEQLRPVWHAFKGIAGGGQHRRSTRGVDSEHVDAESGDRAYGSGHRIGNVVELQIEKDGVAALEERFKDGRAGGGEQLQAYFEPLASALKLVGQSDGGSGVGDIEGHDQALACLVDDASGRKKLRG
jgi:hypothetical protein